jgi:putative transposase
MVGNHGDCPCDFLFDGDDGMPNLQRKSLRLTGYNYAQSGAYFVTICTQRRACLFGAVIDGEMLLNEAGEMVKRTWEQIQSLQCNVEIDAFVVMPNHLHGIIELTASCDATAVLGDIVGAFKSRVTVEYVRGVKGLSWPAFAGRLWQRNFYEHIIRDDHALLQVREYIVNNPMQWELDEENPVNAAARARRQPEALHYAPSTDPAECFNQ